MAVYASERLPGVRHPLFHPFPQERLHLVHHLWQQFQSCKKVFVVLQTAKWSSLSVTDQPGIFNLEALKKVDGWQEIAFVTHSIHTGAKLSLKYVLVHRRGGAFFGLVSKNTRSIEELLTLFPFCKDSFHAEIFHQVVVAGEPLKRIHSSVAHSGYLCSFHWK